MNEFDFGHNLMIIRKDRRMSQYQLGSLVGLTDKAVSKWETGKAVPSFSVIMKLAGQLNCRPEDLMGNAKEEAAPDTSAVSALRRQLWQEAEANLHNTYGEVPPLFVSDRFLRERNMLGHSDVVILFNLIRKLKQAAAQEKKELSFSGPLYNSFTAWLLSVSDVNPLPAHRVCPKCKKTERATEKRCGWDLEEKTCECGEQMLRDGMDLPMEISVCGPGDPFTSIRCEIPVSFMEAAEKLLAKEAQKLYSVNRFHQDPETPEGLPLSCYYFDPKTEEKPVELDFLKRVVSIHNWKTPDGKNASFILLGIPETRKGGRKPKERQPSLRDIMNPDIMIRAMQEEVRNHQAQMEYMELVQQDPDPEQYREGITFDRYISFLCAIHVHYMTDGAAPLAEMTGLNDVTLFPTTPEDIWNLVMDRAEDKDIVRGAAGELIRKLGYGWYIDGISKKDLAFLRQLNLPDWFPIFARNIMTLVSRSQNVHAGIQQLKEAWKKDQIEKKR